MSKLSVKSVPAPYDIQNPHEIMVEANPKWISAKAQRTHVFANASAHTQLTDDVYQHMLLNMTGKNDERRNSGDKKNFWNASSTNTPTHTHTTSHQESSSHFSHPPFINSGDITLHISTPDSTTTNKQKEDHIAPRVANNPFAPLPPSRISIHTFAQTSNRLYTYTFLHVHVPFPFFFFFFPSPSSPPSLFVKREGRDVRRWKNIFYTKLQIHYIHIDFIIYYIYSESSIHNNSIERKDLDTTISVDTPSVGLPSQSHGTKKFAKPLSINTDASAFLVDEKDISPTKQDKVHSHDKTDHELADALQSEDLDNQQKTKIKTRQNNHWSTQSPTVRTLVAHSHEEERMGTPPSASHHIRYEDLMQLPKGDKDKPNDRGDGDDDIQDNENKKKQEKEEDTKELDQKKGEEKNEEREQEQEDKEEEEEEQKGKEEEEDVEEKEETKKGDDDDDNDEDDENEDEEKEEEKREKEDKRKNKIKKQTTKKDRDKYVDKRQEKEKVGKRANTQDIGSDNKSDNENENDHDNGNDNNKNNDNDNVADDDDGYHNNEEENENSKEQIKHKENVIEANRVIIHENVLQQTIPKDDAVQGLNSTTELSWAQIGKTSFHLSFYFLFPMLVNQTLTGFVYAKRRDEQPFNIFFGIILLLSEIVIAFKYTRNTYQLALHTQQNLQNDAVSNHQRILYHTFYQCQTYVHQDMSHFYLQQVSSPEYWYYGFVPCLLLLFELICSIFIQSTLDRIVVLSLTVVLLTVEAIVVAWKRPYLIHLDQKCQIFWRCLTLFAICVLFACINQNVAALIIGIFVSIATIMYLLKDCLCAKANDVLQLDEASDYVELHVTSNNKHQPYALVSLDDRNGPQQRDVESMHYEGVNSQEGGQEIELETLGIAEDTISNEEKVFQKLPGFVYAKGGIPALNRSERTFSSKQTTQNSDKDQYWRDNQLQCGHIHWIFTKRTISTSFAPVEKHA
ncbi:hypothetical protein RFI_17248 [Reticulomyxa filosa]|uniref:Uncharacterized protein n=1 Tax=Reticulomyxa filosa TaxID=46433 RepID=X6N2L9_RETFI|nr:hypothetical protein RFI_17248 [Reticulomyxa filosa]|eukprot:ETO19974.1 hypothetical protein RFI_17248 [Reticulomyxa filosa]